MAAKGYALITGGELRNKGAQAMSFIAVAEAKKRFPELEPVLVSSLDAVPHIIGKLRGRTLREDYKNLDFPIIHPLSSSAYKSATGGKRLVANNARATIENFLLQKTYEASLPYYENAALCMDINGFAFGDKWGFKRCMAYLDKLEMLQTLGVPTYLMPQSFGPFNFRGHEYRILKTRAQHLLPSVSIIFPREHAGFECLAQLSPTANLVISNDLVLQNSGIDLQAIFKSPPPAEPRLPKAGTKTVGIVPNKRTYDHGNSTTIDALYANLVIYLLHMHYEVALIRHSSEDLTICDRIKASFKDDDRVQVFGEDRYCFEYGKLFGRCDFLIASRFHSIVHAYKQGVPCISLGWAVKYRELLDLFGQERLAHDATAQNLDWSTVANSIDYIIENRNQLSRRIAATMKVIQQENVFDLVEADFRSLGTVGGR